MKQTHSFLTPFLLRDYGLVIIAALYWVPTLAGIIFSSGHENNFDERMWHYPAVRQIAENWPQLDIMADSLSASPPFYHWLLAGVAHGTGANLTGLRVVNALVGFLMIAILYGWLRARFSALDSLLLLAPLAISNFVIKSAAWILTDNAGLAAIICFLLIAIKPSDGVSTRIFGAIFATISVLIRQINSWAVVVLIVRSFLIAEPDFRRSKPVFGIFLNSRVWMGLLAAAFPLFSLAYLLLSWQGLVPPQWRSANVGFSTCPQAFLLSMFFLFGLMYLNCEQIRPSAMIREIPWLITGALFGLLVAIATPTSFDMTTGRWGGYLWNIASGLPELASRSLLFLLLAPLGGAAAMLLFRRIESEGGRREAWMWLTCFAAWTLSLVISRQVFQRYFEPTLLVFLITAIGLQLRSELLWGQRIRLLLLGIFQTITTFVTAVIPAMRSLPN